jgi:hypothetical protein
MENPYSELGRAALWWTAQSRASELLPIAQDSGSPFTVGVAPPRRSQEEQIAYAADTGNLLLALAMKMGVRDEDRDRRTNIA